MLLRRDDDVRKGVLIQRMKGACPDWEGGIAALRLSNEQVPIEPALLEVAHVALVKDALMLLHVFVLPPLFPPLETLCLAFSHFSLKQLAIKVPPILHVILLVLLVAPHPQPHHQISLL